MKICIKGMSSFIKNEQKFEQLYERKNNAFDIMRFILATMVIYSHSYPLFYGEMNSGDFLVHLTKGQLDFGALAVYGFFIISGFLITQSLLSSESYSVYLVKRVLRIFPAFLASLFITAIIIGPMISKLSIRNYFIGQYTNGPINFILKNICFNITGYSWTIHDVFLNNPFSGGINGSMWTLKHEFACYLFVMLLSYFYFYKHRILMILLTIFSGIVVILNYKYNFCIINLTGYKWWVISDNEYAAFIKLSYYFITGSLIYLYKDKIYYSYRFLTLSVLILIISTKAYYLKYALLICLPYIIISICIRFKVSYFRKYGDFSYGMYIYAFPIQQIITYIFKDKLNIYSYFISSFVVTLIVAILSWRYIEKPMLNLKDKIVIKKQAIANES